MLSRLILKVDKIWIAKIRYQKVRVLMKPKIVHQTNNIIVIIMKANFQYNQLMRYNQ